MIETAAFAKRFGKATGKPTEWLRETLRLKCRKSLYFLAKAVLGYKDLTPKFHLQMCSALQDPTIVRRLIEVPRGHLKTTCATRTKPVWRLIQQPDPPRFWGADERMGLAMSGGKVASVQLQAIEKHFESNDLFRWLFTELVPDDFQKTTWNLEAMRVAGTTSSDPSITILGVDTKVTGLHFTGGIEDDLVDETIANSAIEIQRRVDFHQYFFPLLEVPGRDWLDTIGNRWGKKDVNGWIRGHEKTCRIFYRKALLKDGTTLWPERFSLELLAELRITLGAYKFSCQYLNDPKDPEASAFASGWLRYYELAKDPEGNDVLALDSGELVPLKSLFIYELVDPAQTPGNRADRTGIVVTGIDPIGRIFVLEARAVRKDPWEALKDVYAIYEKWKPAQIGIEAVAFQRLLIHPLERMARAKNKWLPVVPIKGSNMPGAKEARINQIVGETFASGRAFIRREMSDFVDEYSWFPDPTTTRDLLDAYSLSDQLWTFRFKPKKTAEEEAVAWRRAALKAGMNPITSY